MPARRLQVALFVVGIAAFCALTLAGLLGAYRAGAGLPPLQVDYADHINALVAQEELEPALAQMRLAVILDLESAETPRAVLPAMMRLAGHLEDEENERFASRRLARLNFELGEAHHKEKRTERVVAFWRRALELDPNGIKPLVESRLARDAELRRAFAAEASPSEEP